MEITELTEKLKALGLTGNDKTIAAKVQDWLERNQLTSADVTEKIAEEVIYPELSGEMGKLAKPKEAESGKLSRGGKKGKLGSRENSGKERVNYQSRQAAQVAGVQGEVDAVKDEFEKQADAMSESLAGEMLKTYHGVVPNGVQLFAETIQELEGEGFYQERQTFFRQSIRSVFSAAGASNRQPVDSLPD